MALLELISEKTENLPEINGEFTWAIVNTFRLAAVAPSDDYLTEMAAWTSQLQGSYLVHAHGPYRFGALSSSNYVPCSALEAENAFEKWIREFCGPDSTNPDRILSELIRPHIAGAELFLQTGGYDEYEELNGKGGEEGQTFHEWNERVMREEDPTLDFAASILMGWIEVAAINREAETLTMIITSAD